VNKVFFTLAELTTRLKCGEDELRRAMVAAGLDDGVDADGNVPERIGLDEIRVLMRYAYGRADLSLWPSRLSAMLCEARKETRKV
jgi:hypothetical protein